MASDQCEILQLSFQYLSTAACIFVALSVLFGIYIVLGAFAIWATYRQPGKASLQLRIVTITLFVVLVGHYLGRAVMFGEHRSLVTVSTESEPWPIPPTFVANITTTLAGLISDGLLAWRMYIVYGRARWAFYAPVLMISVTTLLGLYSDFQLFAFYHSVEDFVDQFYTIIWKTTVTWGWMMFGTNTIMTGLIIARILYISRRAKMLNAAQAQSRRPYRVLLEAMIESASVTWVGLLVYEIASVAPQGHITTHFDVGFVMGCIIPIFFGISQCLITIRLGLARTSDLSGGNAVSSLGNPRSIVVEVQKVSEVITSSASYLSDLESGSTAHDITSGEKALV